jgi:hypothetical protein
MYAIDNEFSKLGMKLKVFAILTIVTTTLSLVESYLLPFGLGISGFIAFPLLIFQILIIVSAKKAAKAYNNAQLNIFGTLMIVSMILSFGSVGVIVIMSMSQAMDYVLGGGTGTMDILSITLTGEIISLATLACEAVAWIFMVKFFDTLQELDARTRGKPGAILVFVGSCIAVASAAIVGIPTAFMIATIDPYGIGITIPFPYIIAGELFSLATVVLSVIGYFIMSQVFVQLGGLRQPGSGPSDGTEAVSWRGIGPIGGLPEPTRGADRAPIDYRPAVAGAPRCPSCGSSLVSTDPRAMFCGECGAKLPGRG